MGEAVTAQTHERLFDLAEDVEEIVDQLASPEAKRMAEGAAWDLNALARMERDIKEIEA